MENIMIYPYNRDYSVYVEHQGLLNGYRVSSLVSPFGWGLVGETLKFGNREYVVTDDFSEALSCSSVVWFVNDDLPGKITVIISIRIFGSKCCQWKAK